jgi:hypothetical protein
MGARIADLTPTDSPFSDAERKYLSPAENGQRDPGMRL